MVLGHLDIERRIPHSGSMCLLDAVLQWDERHIICRPSAQLSANPLSRDGVVSAVCAIEYAAQAAALHGALLEGRNAPRAGVIAKLSEVDLCESYVPNDAEPLSVRVDAVAVDASGARYNFDVGSPGRPIVRGRLLVAFFPFSAL